MTGKERFMSEIVLNASKQSLNNEPYVSFPSKKEMKEWLLQFEDGHELSVHLYDKRNLNMNNLLHMWIGYISSETGMNFDEAKYWSVIINFGYIEVVEDDGSKTKAPISTSKLGKKKFAEGLTKMEIWCKEFFNITLPYTETLQKYLK